MAKKDNPQQGSLFKKKVPKMPKGYYSGDKPNPNLRAFVEQHIKERPYDPATDDYDVPAFDKPIETTKATAIYNMHTYWSKKPHDAIRQYVRHYTKPDDLVLDPFCGSGGTALAALMEGRKAIAIDRSPAATFITKNHCAPVEIDELKDAFDELTRKVRPEIDWLYETRCHLCGGKATTVYTIYSETFRCNRCLEVVPYFDCILEEGVTAKGKPKKIRVCPKCYNRGVIEEIDPGSHRLGATPVMFSIRCENKCKPKQFERFHNDPDHNKQEYFRKYDLEKLQNIEKQEIPYWYPCNRMMNVPETTERWGLLWRTYLKGISTVNQFFTKRNLWALSAYFDCARKQKNDDLRDLLMLAATANLAGLSIMNQYIPGATFPTKVLKGTYYVPPMRQIENVWLRMESKIRGIYRSLQAINEGLQSNQLSISNEDARFLTSIKDNSIDYVFTDPPYSWKVQYGEANFLWESWLKLNTHWLNDEIIVNEVRGRTEREWASMMRTAIQECYRVLKPGRWLSLCYHDTSEGTWALIQDILAEVGFLPDRNTSALYIDAREKSQKQLVSDKATKRDLVINFRKPKPDEITAIIAITGDEDKATFTEKVLQIIRDFIGTNPGITKDHVYDEVVSRMVRSGQMEPHDFDELLRTVAEEVKTPVMKNLFEQKEPDLFGTHEIGRWYLKETELVMADAAENAREDEAANKIGVFIKGFLKKNPADEGVHYSDLFEYYIYAVKDKPRRQLAEFLPDYFYKTEQGTWRLPASVEEEKAKGEARVKGLGRRVKRYIAQIEQGAVIPDLEQPNDATLAEWIRHCKRAGLYEQGKLLYEKGGLNPDNLPEEAMVNVEEDYQVCVRMLLRVPGTAATKKQGRN